MMHPKASRRNECSQNIVLNHCVEIYRYKSFVPDSFLSVTIPTLTTTYFLRRPDPCMQCCPSTSSERNLPCCWCTRARAQSQGATRWPSTSIGRLYEASRRRSVRKLWMRCWRRTASVPQLLTYSIRGRTARRAGTGVGSGTTIMRWRARTLTPPVSQRRLTSSVYQTPWHVHGAPTSSVCPLRVCAASSISLDSSTPQASRPSCAHATARGSLS